MKAHVLLGFALGLTASPALADTGCPAPPVGWGVLSTVLGQSGPEAAKEEPPAPSQYRWSAKPAALPSEVIGLLPQDAMAKLTTIASVVGRRVVTADEVRARADRVMTLRLADAVAAVPMLEALDELYELPVYKKPEHRLPQRVKLEEAAAAFDGTVTGGSFVGRNVYHGFKLPGTLSPTAVQQQRALSEVLNRLARNDSKTPDQQFVVEYNGNTEIRSLAQFLAALQAGGHQLSGSIVIETADFGGFALREPDDSFRPVQLVAFVRTGHFDADGKELLMPAPHGGLHVRVQGPVLDGTVQFYQGLSGTSFQPRTLGALAPWMGGRLVDEMDATEIVDATVLSGVWMDVVESLSAHDGMFMYGYGQTGVCVTATAIVQTAIKGRTTLYPLVIDKPRVIAYMRELSVARPHLAPTYQKLIEIVENLPDDTDPNAPAVKQRMLDSTPYDHTPDTLPEIGRIREAFGGAN